MKAPALDNHALIIGVEDYSIYDRSTDLPVGTSDLPGAVNDAVAWFRQCVYMGFSPDRIRVLTTARLTPGDLGPGGAEARIGTPTHDAITSGIEWLAGAVGGERPASGLLVFSGHGVQDPGTSLCPSDVTGSLDNVVHAATLLRRLQGSRAARRLTWLLDCCHAQVGLRAAEGLHARLTAKSKGFPVPEGEMGERVIAASRRDQSSEYSVFDGRWQGAFTWAMTSTMGQWQTVVEDGIVRLDISHGELVKRSGALLSALSFAQEPCLSGPKGLAGLAFLHPGGEARAGETSSEPTHLRAHGQLWPDKYLLEYQTFTGQWVQLASIDVTTAGETWVVSQSAAASLSGAASLRLSRVSELPTISGSPITETAATLVSWATTENPAYPTSGVTFSGRYTYSTGTTSTSGTLSLNLQTTSTGTGLAKISTTVWYNPDTTGQNIRLQDQPPIVMSPVTGSYRGTCNTTTSPLTAV